MIKKITFILGLLVSFNTFSQEKIKGNGILSLKKTDLTAFNKIIINNDFKVTLIKSNSPAIEIETDENLHEAILFNVSDSTFVLNTNNKIRPKKVLNITVFCQENLKSITLNNDSKIETLNTLNVSDLKLTVNNSAKANLDVKASKFNFTNNNDAKIQIRSKTKLNIDSDITNLTIAGSSNTYAIIRSDSLHVQLKKKGNLEIDGSTNYLKASAVNNSDFNGKNLNSKEANAITKDNSEIIVKVSDKIIIESSNKSKVELYGNPLITLEKFTGTAKLHKKELTKK